MFFITQRSAEEPECEYILIACGEKCNFSWRDASHDFITRAKHEKHFKPAKPPLFGPTIVLLMNHFAPYSLDEIVEQKKARKSVCKNHFRDYSKIKCLIVTITGRWEETEREKVGKSFTAIVCLEFERKCNYISFSVCHVPQSPLISADKQKEIAFVESSGIGTSGTNGTKKACITIIEFN